MMARLYVEELPAPEGYREVEFAEWEEADFADCDKIRFSGRWNAGARYFVPEETS